MVFLVLCAIPLLLLLLLLGVVSMLGRDTKFAVLLAARVAVEGGGGGCVVELDVDVDVDALSGDEAPKVLWTTRSSNPTK